MQNLSRILPSSIPSQLKWQPKIGNQSLMCCVHTFQLSLADCFKLINKFIELVRTCSVNTWQAVYTLWKEKRCIFHSVLAVCGSPLITVSRIHPLTCGWIPQNYSTPWSPNLEINLQVFKKTCQDLSAVFTICRQVFWNDKLGKLYRTLVCKICLERQLKQEQIVWERPARFNLDPGKGTRVTGMTDNHL